MNIYVYSDESGVLDKVHNNYFIFGGLIFLSKNDRDIWSRKYKKAERTIRQIEKINKDNEVKATTISNKSKSKLYRSLNQVEKFGIVIHQKELSDKLFKSKKNKQRYLDWTYKIAVKTKFEEMIWQGKINSSEIENIYFFIDEHTTATNGKYELNELLEMEFKHGMFNYSSMIYYPSIFKNLKQLKVNFCNSEQKTLVRAADIVANHIYYLTNKNKGKIESIDNISIIHHPFKYN